LPIEAESQDTALRIFSTLNDRGLPLSDADIFKAQFYQFYNDKNQKDDFIKRWKKLEEICEQIFHPAIGTPMDELFTRYMYYLRAKQGNKSTTTEALRKFYEKNKYESLKSDQTFRDLEILADFWKSISKQDSEHFSEKVLKRLFVLNYAPNGMWTYFTSVYFMQNKNANGELNDEEFLDFLTKTTAFIWAYAVTNSGVNALRTPIFAEMVKIVNGEKISFAGFRFNEKILRVIFEDYNFKNGRPITKSMLTWWAFTDEKQDLPSLETQFEIEHIFAKNRQKNDGSLKNADNLESLGNKALLEKRINIRASDYRFPDKIKYYKGFVNNNGQQKQGTQIAEYDYLAIKADFTETDIENRRAAIIDKFISYLKDSDLI
jgi:hypothetical protein